MMSISKKPDPQGFNKIINQNNQPHDDFLMVGDSMSDHQAAINANIDFFHISKISDHLSPDHSL